MCTSIFNSKKLNVEYWALNIYSEKNNISQSKGRTESSNCYLWCRHYRICQTMTNDDNLILMKMKLLENECCGLMVTERVKNHHFYCSFDWTSSSSPFLERSCYFCFLILTKRDGMKPLISIHWRCLITVNNYHWSQAIRPINTLLCDASEH